MDQNGHGTHVAGIVGAREGGDQGVTGVAPGVRFVALKVFGPFGHTWDDIILQALEKAYDMRVDVVWRPPPGTAVTLARSPQEPLPLVPGQWLWQALRMTLPDDRPFLILMALPSVLNRWSTLLPCHP